VREVCGGACHVVERILKSSKFVAHITFVPLAGTMREHCANLAPTLRDGACQSVSWKLTMCQFTTNQRRGRMMNDGSAVHTSSKNLLIDCSCFKSEAVL